MYNKATYPNQKVVKLKKAIYNEKEKYTIHNLEAYFKAIRELTPVELKVYLYITANQDGFEFALSTQDISDTTGASRRKVQEAINSLIKKGYIRWIEGNYYIFEELR